MEARPGKQNSNVEIKLVKVVRIVAMVMLLYFVEEDVTAHSCGWRPLGGGP